MTLKGSESLRLARHARLAQLDKHQTSKPVMVSCVSSVPNWRQLYFLLKLFKTPRCQFCTQMLDLCYLRKHRMLILKYIIYSCIYIKGLYCYHPQRSWGKVMFLQASVILLTGGVPDQVPLPGPGTSPRDQVPP